MPIEIREQLVLMDEEEKELLFIYRTASGNIALSEDSEDSGSFFCAFDKADWEGIKKFIDNKFK